MQRQVVQLGLSAIATTVLASSAWAAATPWTPNTSGGVGVSIWVSIQLFSRHWS